jgi:(4-(4-[2-(gamma-L-glutamylamino)ethyl]phenoxymethyl)furan-2-yl)methanamine synthase
MEWWGIDVGGANLKCVDPSGRACSRPFPLWQRSGELAAELADVLSGIDSSCGLAATMTGELCDCFKTKAEGVRFIVSALREACRGARLAIYGVDGRFHPVESVNKIPALAAASNWHALATFAARWLPGGTGTVVDIGSTTSDIVPVRDLRVETPSTTDTERLVAGELVYSGVTRTPVMALVSSLPYRGEHCPVAAEFFASTADVYFLLDCIRGGVGDAASTTADGRPMTRLFAIDRLARSICADRTTFDEQDALVAASWVQQQQMARLTEALAQVLAGYPAGGGDFIVAGSGEFLARQLVSTSPRLHCVASLSERLGPNGSQGATAIAVATLAREQIEQAQEWP